MKPFRLLIGGSPCTHWSIAQSKNRETTASGEGWELFLNYVIAKGKFQPDAFLYENNKSVAQAIKEQINRELGGVQQVINSSLVSAQNRQRFYQHSGGFIPLPQDRGILLKDILETSNDMTWLDKSYAIDANYFKTPGPYLPKNQSGRRQMVAHPIALLGKDSRPNRVYSPDGKSIAVIASDGGGSATGLVAVPACVASRGRYVAGDKAEQQLEIRKDGKTNTLTSIQKDNRIIEFANGIDHPICLVKNDEITVKDKTYPIRLPDGFYIIRKLSVVECCRLQTMPDNYFLHADGTKIISDTQAYKALGNGWTAEVIIHLLAHLLKDVPKDYPIVTLSMYDGIGTGRYCLDQLGYSNIRYYSYEIDKYAAKVASVKYTDIVQLGNAFNVRKTDWMHDVGTWSGDFGEEWFIPFNVNPSFEYIPLEDFMGVHK